MAESLARTDRISPAAPDEFVEFWPAGTRAKGRFRCTACGNAITVREVLPRCAVCNERLWERGLWSPFGGRAES
jgi:hypothetical protein